MKSSVSLECIHKRLIKVNYSIKNAFIVIKIEVEVREGIHTKRTEDHVEI